MFKVTKLVPMFVVISLLLFGVMTALAAPERQNQTIVDIAAADDRFETLVTALQEAELVDTLNGEGPFTVFAPTDEAFEALPDGTLDSLLNDIPALTDVLLYHVVPGNVMAADVVNLDSADTALGQALDITVDGNTVMVNDAQVVITDIEASNGVIHVIDSVLIPPAAEEETMMEEAPQTIVDIAAGDERFSTLVTALQEAELVDTLNGEGPFTVFAPTNEAFEALPDGTLDSLLNDIPALTDILLYHVVPGNVMAADVVNLDSAETVLGPAIDITVDGETVMVNNAQVVITDLEASNGVIHVIDSVLLPPSSEPMAEEEQMMSSDVSCAQDYVVQADDWLSKIAEKVYGDPLAYTAIFEATNEAAAAGHMYAQIANPDVIEVGQTLCIPGDDPMTNTIVDIAAGDERFSTLVTALSEADLVTTLQGEGPFTVFAPTNEAFNALPDGTLESLLNDIPALTDVLLYHVVPGKVMAADVVNLDSAETVLGPAIDITVDGETVKINDATVVITDLEASNGVIHVIDSVLLPPSN